jgi:anaerobic selenocysteine-containing dehydrogenase
MASPPRSSRTSPPPPSIRRKGKVCVKAYGLVQKTYNPNRILTPMKRTNPKKGRDEDPGFVPISWDEALDIVADKLKAVRAKGLLDEAGLPRVAASFGHGGTPSNYMGTFPAFLAAWGRSTSASARARASSACTPSTCTASSGTAPSPSPPTRPTAATTSPRRQRRGHGRRGAP